MSRAEGREVIRASGLAESDRDELERLAAACNQHEGLDLPLILSEPAQQFFCYEDAALIGYLEIDGTTVAEACGMVHPDHRRRGVGRALVEAVQREWRERGIASFLLVCDAAATSATSFASAIGAPYRYSEHRMELDPGRLPTPTKSPLQLRRARIDDVDVFVDVMASAFQHDEADIPRQRAKRVDRFRNPNCTLYLAELGGRAIGGLEVLQVPLESRVFINAFAVRPEHQRRGWGRQMLVETTTALVTAGAEHVMIEVQTDNRQALSLYQKSGFDEVSTYNFYRIETELA